MEPLVTPRRLRRMREVLSKRQRDLVLFVDNVENEHNFSAIIRTCDAVGVHYIYVYSLSGSFPKINKGITMGAHNWVHLELVEDKVSKIKEFKGKGYQVVATWLGEGSVNFRDVDYTKPTLIAVGNELEGVSQEVLELADHRIVIPMYGMVQSLNVSVATGIILYEAQRQRELRGFYESVQLPPDEIERFLRKWAVDDVLEERRARNRSRLRGY